MYSVAFIYPLTTIPQIITIFANRSSENISLISWLLYLVCDGVALLYALKHHLRPLIIQGFIWLVMYSAVIGGILLYR